MGLFIRNAEVERKARELATLTGDTLTGALDKALDAALDRAEPVRPHDPAAKLARIKAATEEFRRRTGWVKPDRLVTKADFDEL